METYTDAELDQMFTDGLLCEVCQERPLTQAARFHDCMVCDSCAEGEPTPEDAAADEEAERTYQEMLDQEQFLAEQAAHADDAERWYADNDTRPPVEHDLF